MLLKTFVLAGLLLVGAGVASAEVRVEASLDPETVQVGEQAILTVSVSGAVRIDQGPKIPDLPGLEIRGAGQSTNISFVNGRMSRSVSFQYVIFPSRPGQYPIGPIEIQDGGKAYRSGTVTLTAAGSGGGGGQGTPGGGGSPGGSSGGGSPGSSWDPVTSGEATEGNNLYVHAEVDRDRVAVGEQVTLRFQFFQRAGYPLLDAPQYNPPTTEGFWREDLPPQRTSSRTIRGVPYQVTELVYALFPTQAGRLEVGPGSLECMVRDRARVSRDPFSLFGGFFSEKQVRLQTRPIVIRVDPLPEPKPDDFTGGVGEYRLDASLERTSTAQNSPVTLTLSLTGTGNVSTVGDPTLPDLVGMRSYPSGSEVRTDKQGDVVRGTKTFKVVLVPESTGRHEIPPVRLSVYDPRQKRYVRLVSDALAVQVGPAVGGGVGEPGDVARVGRDLRTIRTSPDLQPAADTPLERRVGFWALQALPLLILGFAFYWRSRRERMEANWGMVLSRGAAGRLRRDFDELERAGLPAAESYGRLDQALERYLTDRFRTAARGCTRDELTAVLASEKIPAEAITEVRSVLDRCDFARFAPAAQTDADFRQTLAQARHIPELLERHGPGGAKRGAKKLAGARLLALLVPGLLAAASLGLSSGSAQARMPKDQANAALRRGHEAYGRGDYLEAARAYGAVLAGGWESPDLLLDLGNANYRAGRLGWAIFYFERGRRLSPSDPDLRANLDLAVQQTRDKTPGADDSRFLRTLVALQDRSSLSGALRTAAVFWWVFLVWLGVRIALGTGRSRLQARGLLATGILCGCLLAASGGWAGMKLVQKANAPDAVVVADDLPVHSNPDAEATVEFTLHAGTGVRLGRVQGEYREVIFSEKLRGWAESTRLALLDAPGSASVPLRDLQSAAADRRIP